jgi:molybdopterin/thiamine biosynthesis adenylyltransferase
LLTSRTVVVVGVGTVGSQIAYELARAGVGHLWLVDGDRLEEHNLLRHALTREYLQQNKATAMADFLTKQVPGLQVQAEPRDLDGSVSDDFVDFLLQNADLVVVATDDREAQRRIAGRAITLDIPAILPALYGDNGGEVFAQRSARHPCFYCWDGYRSGDERVRGVAAINADTLGVLQLAVHLSLGILDPMSPDARLMVADDDPRPLQIFIRQPLTALRMSPQPWRSDCPYCPLGPPSEVVQANDELLTLRTNVWHHLTWMLGTLVVLVVLSFIIISGHIHQATAIGAGLTVAILVGLWMLYATATDLSDAWTTYRHAQRLRDRRR